MIFFHKDFFLTKVLSDREQRDFAKMERKIICLLEFMLTSLQHVSHEAGGARRSTGVSPSYCGGNGCRVTCNSPRISWWAIAYRCLIEQRDHGNASLSWNLYTRVFNSLKIYDSWIRSQEHKSYYRCYLRKTTPNTPRCRQAAKAGLWEFKVLTIAFGGGVENHLAVPILHSSLLGTLPTESWTKRNHN